ncbi:MAG TPA: AraC family transcriptional regulator [Devosia sp.]|jgi:AraC family transcriptional regulator|nr:AraC family transcriptional regulator [Devosia sp.]
MSAIVKTIWMIESRVGTPVSLDDLAIHAGVSRYHLSRIFPLATGYSISGYLRGRRLSVAARTLANGAPDILQVALDAGYGSHEAFTRAFRDQFGTTPEEVRRRRDLTTLKLVESLPMDNSAVSDLAAPVIESRGAMKMAGLREKLDMSNPNAIPALWQRFGEYLGNIPGAVSNAAYGVVADMSGELCDYMAAAEIASSAELLPEFKTLTLPARRWARFSHRGHISQIRSTITAIYDYGLSNAGLEQDEGVSFVEYYGPDFDPRTGQGTVEIWIGLKD